MGMSFIPSSNFAWDAIFTCSVLTSNQMILRVVLGTKPRKMPFQELFRNFDVRCVEDLIHTRHPKVWKFCRFSFCPSESSRGDCNWLDPTRPLNMQSWCQKA